MKREQFIARYVHALRNGSAGLFVGAGLSMKAGYPSWRELVTEMAEEVGLDASVEPDLPTVVQFFLNKQKKRGRLTDIITQNFSPERDIPDVYRTFARLPLRSVWTTNYDELLERAWREQRLRMQVKAENKHLTHDDPTAHAVLYKMHGTVRDPADVVIAKGDYEGYRRSRGEFITLLHSHLVSRHILFLGLSFTDPNLNHLFALIREALDEHTREHFALVKRPQQSEFKGTGARKKFEIAVARHDLWVDDLKNYGIQCVEIDRWEEIDEIMQGVERKLSSTSVMVSGSYPDAMPSGHADDRTRIEAVARAVGHMIAKHGLKLVSGFGLVVGSATLGGALEELYRDVAPNLDQRLFLRPFPQTIPAGVDRQAFYQRYREDLVRQAGASVFIAGVKIDGGDPVPAPGVANEFDIIRALDRLPIPIGCTGGMAAELWSRVDAQYHDILGRMPRKAFDTLNDGSATPEKLAQAVWSILDWHAKNGR